MTALVVESSRTPLFGTLPDPTQESPGWQARSAGATVTTRGLRLVAAHAPESTSSVLGWWSQVPVWMKAVLDDVERFDEDAVLSASTLNRLTRALTMLPVTMPQPEVGVGEDGTVGLEWTFDTLDLEIYVSNHPDEDALIVDSVDTGTVEVSLFQGLAKVAKALNALSAG
jgi:hypothetical protein